MVNSLFMIPMIKPPRIPRTLLSMPFNVLTAPGWITDRSSWRSSLGVVRAPRASPDIRCGSLLCPKMQNAWIPSRTEIIEVVFLLSQLYSLYDLGEKHHIPISLDFWIKTMERTSSTTKRITVFQGLRLWMAVINYAWRHSGVLMDVSPI